MKYSGSAGRQTSPSYAGRISLSVDTVLADLLFYLAELRKERIHLFEEVFQPFLLKVGRKEFFLEEEMTGDVPAHYET